MKCGFGLYNVIPKNANRWPFFEKILTDQLIIFGENMVTAWVIGCPILIRSSIAGWNWSRCARRRCLRLH